MVKHGSPPYRECSSRGDRRFSAFYARLRAYNGKSIEEIYQAAKVFPGGITNLSPKEAKGKKAINQEEVSKLYSALWDLYISENPHLLEEIMRSPGFSDMFGQEGHCCQATELWRIKSSILEAL